MNKKNGSEDGLSNGQKLMLYPVNAIVCRISHVDNISNFAQQLTKFLSSLHINLSMVSR